MAVNIRNDKPHEVSFSEHTGSAISKKNTVRAGEAQQAPAEELSFETAALPVEPRVRPDAIDERNARLAAQDEPAAADNLLRTERGAAADAHVVMVDAAREEDTIVTADTPPTARNVVYTEAGGLQDAAGASAGAGEGGHRVSVPADGDASHREYVSPEDGRAPNVVSVAAGAEPDPNRVQPVEPAAGPHLEYVPPAEPLAADAVAAAAPVAVADVIAPAPAAPVRSRTLGRSAPRSPFEGISVAVSAELRERVGSLRTETEDLAHKLEGLEQRLNVKSGARKR